MTITKKASATRNDSTQQKHPHKKASASNQISTSNQFSTSNPPPKNNSQKTSFSSVIPRAKISIPYLLVRSRRKTLAIHVKRESGVEVRAPMRVSQAEIERFVISRAPWIEKHLQRFNAMPEFSGPDLHFGGNAWVLGEEWQLAPLGNGSDDDQKIELKLAWDSSKADFQKALDQWYAREASAWFEQRHQYWRRRMAALDLPDSFVTVRKMRRRWGSARRNGKLVFNTALLKYPPECIDCVVVHELCHLVHFNHSPAFYRLMSEVMPSWKEADARLCELALRY